MVRALLGLAESESASIFLGMLYISSTTWRHVTILITILVLSTVLIQFVMQFRVRYYLDPYFFLYLIRILTHIPDLSLLSFKFPSLSSSQVQPQSTKKISNSTLHTSYCLCTGLLNSYQVLPNVLPNDIQPFG